MAVFVIAVTGLLGAIVLSAAVAAHYALFEVSSLSGEGQSILAFVLSLPVGFLIGGVVGFIKQCHSSSRSRDKYLLVITGLISTLLVILIGVLSATSRDLSLQELMTTIVSPWCLYPLIASMGVMLGGVFFKVSDPVVPLSRPPVR